MFVFLVNKYGKVDCVSKEVHDILGICPKMIDSDLYLTHVLKGLTLDRLQDFQPGEEYVLNKEYLRDLQQQLDIPADPLLLNPNTLELRHFYSMRSKLEDQPQYMKVQVKQVALPNDDSYFEVLVVPVTDPVSTNHMHIPGVGVTSKVLAESVDKNELPQLQEEQEQYGSQSVTSSTTSRASKQFEQIRDIKEVTVLKTVPPLILKLSRSINLFFVVMFVTSLVLLIVNIKDKLSFESGLNAVQDAFRIQYYVANIRLRFFYLHIVSNKPNAQ